MCFYKAGTHYVEFKTNLEEAKERAMSAAIEHKVEMRSESIQ